MNSVSVINKNLDMHVENEDFFALKVVSDPSVESAKYVEFCFGDTDLLEFSLDRETGIVKKILLVLCSHFEILDEILHPASVSEIGCISIDLPERNECGAFNVRVYRDAVGIIISSLPVQRMVSSGRVFFGLSADNDLVSVTVAGMTEKEVSHTAEELKLGIA